MKVETSLDQFGDRVRQIRESRGLTQAALAEVIGKARASITNMEGGRQQPTLPTLVTLARALGVSAGVLLGEEPIPPLPRIANVVIDVAYTARCSICGPLGQWQDRAEAERARKEHNVPHPPEEQTGDDRG